MCRDSDSRLIVSSAVLPDSGAVTLFLPDAQGSSHFPVCWKIWDMAAANVVCREHGHQL